MTGGAVIQDPIRRWGIGLGFGAKWTRCLLAKLLSEAGPAPTGTTRTLAEGAGLAPRLINAFVQAHKSFEVEVLYAQAPIHTHAYRTRRVCKPPRSSLLHLPEMSNRSPRRERKHRCAALVLPSRFSVHVAVLK